MSRNAPTVFVCYAAEDANALKQLRTHLVPLEREGLIRFWAATEIEIDERKEEAIDLALADAKSAVLLISAAFLASPAVAERELPFLFARHAAGAVKILPVFLSPSGVEDFTVTFDVAGQKSTRRLTDIQGVGSPKRTLVELSLADRDREFVRLAKRLRELAALPSPALSQPRSPRERKPATPKLRRLELERIRGFESLLLDFGESPRSMTVIIGRNGTCKTTLLRAIAVAIAPVHERPSLLVNGFGDWLHEDAPKGEIRVQLTGEEEVRTVGLERRGNAEIDRSIETLTTQPVFFCAYGLGRYQAGGEPSGNYRVFEAVSTLFRYDARLAAPELELRRIRDLLGQSQYEKLHGSLKRALGLGPKDTIDLAAGGGIRIGGDGIGRNLPVDAWADGYRMTFLWLVDLFGWARRAQAFDDHGDICGIVLVDEIEQHLHPAMQAGLLELLRAALPKVQWIVTTHSPLVALSANAGEIVALRRQEDGRVVMAEVPDLRGYSADDILVEESLFGLADPYDAATSRQHARYRELARKGPEHRGPLENQELANLSREIAPVSLASLKDDPVLAKLASIEKMLREREPSS